MADETRDGPEAVEGTPEPGYPTGEARQKERIEKGIEAGADRTGPGPVAPPPRPPGGITQLKPVGPPPPPVVRLAGVPARPQDVPPTPPDPLSASDEDADDEEA